MTKAHISMKKVAKNAARQNWRFTGTALAVMSVFVLYAALKAKADAFDSVRPVFVLEQVATEGQPPVAIGYHAH